MVLRVCVFVLVSDAVVCNEFVGVFSNGLPASVRHVVNILRFLQMPLVGTILSRRCPRDLRPRNWLWLTTRKTLLNPLSSTFRTHPHLMMPKSVRTWIFPRKDTPPQIVLAVFPGTTLHLLPQH